MLEKRVIKAMKIYGDIFFSSDLDSERERIKVRAEKINAIKYSSKLDEKDIKNRIEQIR